MATEFLKSTGHPVASHKLDPKAAVNLQTVLTGPQSKLYLEFEQGYFDPVAGP